MFYYLVFRNPELNGSVKAGSLEEARKIGDQIGECWDAFSIPYPASPTLNDVGDFPPFCMTPHQCRGRGSCPHSHACND